MPIESVLVLGYYALLALGLAFSLFVFVTLKREMWKLQAGWRERQAEFEAAVREREAEIDRMKERLREAEERAGVSTPRAPPRAGAPLENVTGGLRNRVRTPSRSWGAR